MLHGGGSRTQQLGTALCDGTQCLAPGLDAAFAFLVFQAFAQRDGNRAGQGLASQQAERRTLVSLAVIAGVVGALGAGLMTQAARWLWDTFLAALSAGWNALAAWWNAL